VTTLVLGCGNVLLGDDAAGVWVIEQLRRSCAFPAEVSLVEAGTLGLDLLPELDGVERLLVVDAVAGGRPPGSLVRLQGDEVPAVFDLKTSPHQVGLADLLAGAKLLGRWPRQVVLWGVEPAELAPGTRFSLEVERALPSLQAAVLEELEGWGLAAKPLEDAPAPAPWWLPPAAGVAR
jgi:hydrogenase maturation protease